MADFVSDTPQSGDIEEEPMKSVSGPLEPLAVRYCPTCSLPPEYCEYGPCFDKCLPWIAENMPEVLSEEVLARMVSKVSLDENGDPVENADGEDEGEEKKKKKRGGPKLKKVAEAGETRVVIAKVQRQKRKYITVVAGLETVPGLKIKDAAKACGKKFSSGASVNEGATGAKEVVIQGDVGFDLPPLLTSKFNVPPSCIYFLENGTLTPFQE